MMFIRQKTNELVVVKDLEEKGKNRVLVFDFDGVLAKPWTHPETHYEQVPAILKILSQKYYVCVASFNPRAALAIASWESQKTIDAVRCGANHEWAHKYDEVWREGMSKLEMITSILKQLNLRADHPVEFYDDDSKNVDSVNLDVNRTAFIINTQNGLTFQDIKHLL